VSAPSSVLSVRYGGVLLLPEDSEILLQEPCRCLSRDLGGTQPPRTRSSVSLLLSGATGPTGLEEEEEEEDGRRASGLLLSSIAGWVVN
jgi:hypothetical protein